MAYGDPVTHATGDVFPAADWNTYVRDNFRALHDLSTIASANTIAPTTVLNKITGTTQINTITPGTLTRVTLWIVSAGLTISTSGNIIPDGNTAYTSAANDVVEFVYDSGTAKWYQVGAGSGGLSVVADSGVLSSVASWASGSFATSGRQLVIEMSIRSAAAVNIDDVLIQPNGDTAANYDYLYNELNASGVNASSDGFANTSLIIRKAAPGTNATNAAMFGAVVARIPGYASGTPHKQMIAQAGGMYSTTTLQTFQSLNTGRWRSTAAISSVTVKCSGGNIAAGSRITVSVI